MLSAALLPMLLEDSRESYPFAGLFDGPLDDLADFQALVQRFNELIADPSPLSTAAVNYLTSEGSRVESDGPLDYHHRDYWVDKLIRKNVVISGRLPWSENSPENIAEADPLGLVRVVGTNDVRPDAIIMDPQGANEAQSDALAPVRVTYGSNDCTTPGGLDKTANLSKSLWSGSTGSAYRYQFWTRLEDLHESGGGSTVRFLDAAGVGDTTVTVYVRYAADHQLAKELVLRKRTTGTHAKQIIIRGYPGERPVIRMGNSFVHTQTISITGGTPDEGGFKLTFNGQTTGNIDWNASGSAVASALALLTNVDAADISVTGNLPGTPVGRN